MRKINLVLILALILFGCSKGVPVSPLPQKDLSLPLNSIDNIYFTKDNGLLISGRMGNEYTLVKTDGNMNISWIKNNYDWGKLYGGGGWGAPFYSIRIIKAFQDNQGNYVCMGSIQQGGDVVFSSCLIIVLDKKGEQLKTYPFDNLFLWSAIQTTDGYALFGNQLIKLDNQFQKKWTKNIYNDELFPGAITYTNNGGFAVTGRYNSDQIYLQKLNSNGNAVFTQSYKHNDFPFDEVGFDVRQLSDNGFLIVGRDRDATPASDKINCQIIRTTPDGDTVWTKRFGFSTNSWINQILSQNQNESVLQATIGYPDDGEQKTAFIKIDLNGEILKTKITDQVALVAHSPANQYLIATLDGSGKIKITVMGEDELLN